MKKPVLPEAAGFGSCSARKSWVIRGQCLFPNSQPRLVHRAPMSSVRVPRGARAVLKQQVATTSLPPPLSPFLLSRPTLLVDSTDWNQPRRVSIPFCSLGAISGSFYSSFDVLFNFPSQYFSAIGLCVIFRFSRNLPAALCWIHNQHDSKAGKDLDTQT